MPRHAHRLAKEAAEREWRVFLTAKFDRTWKAMVRFRAKVGVGAMRFRELMALPHTIENIGSNAANAHPSNRGTERP